MEEKDAKKCTLCAIGNPQDHFFGLPTHAPPIAAEQIERVEEKETPHTVKKKSRVSAAQRGKKARARKRKELVHHQDEITKLVELELQHEEA
jgi:hypothetical protein